MDSGPRLPVPTWFVGCGNMGGAIVAGWRAAGVDVSNLVVIRPSGKPVEGVRVVQSFGEAGAPPKMVVLAFKPQRLDEIAPELRNWITSRATIVSMLAGAETGSLRERFPGAGSIVRVMPNIPVSIRRGVVGLYSADADDAVRQELSNLFSPLGYAPWTSDEAKLAALGSIAGAGPAYVARFIDALAKAGEKGGLSPELASTLARETVLGTAWLAASSGEDMNAIAKRVASPNGTTEAGLAVLDRDNVLDQLVAVTIDAAARRGAELAEEAKSPSLA